MNKTIFRQFLTIVDSKTILILSLTCIATAACIRFGFGFNVPLEMIGVAIIFPIVFSINAAYSRREKALDHYATIKSVCAALYYMHKNAISQPGNEAAARISSILTELLKNITQYFAEGNHSQKILHSVYSLIAQAHQSSSRLKEEGLSPSEATVVYRYCDTLLAEFERLRNIYVYRTPISLRAYSRVFLNIFPLIFAPYFAHLSLKNAPALGFLVGGLYSVLLVSLDNIQDDLENPFDQKGTDDIQFDGTEFLIEVRQAEITAENSATSQDKQ